jgi:glycosyltransferase involved in cell wall biosynthesis
VNRRKILFLHDSTELGGSEKSLLCVVKNLSSKKFIPVVCVPDKGFLFRQLKSAGVDVRVLKIRRLRKTMNLFKLLGYLIHMVCMGRQLRLLIVTEGISLIHSNSLSAQIQMNLVRGIENIPMTWHVRDIFPSQLLIRLSVRCAALRATRIVAISEAAKDNLRRMGLPEEKIRVIYNGADLSTVGTSSRRSEVLRGTFKVDSAPCVVGMIGSISYSKGQDIFVRAAHLIRERFPDTLFVIVGGYFPENESFYHHVRQLVAKVNMEEKILFTGSIQEVEELMCSLDIVVSVSREREGLGRSILEGMASGKPVVGTKVGGIPELIDDDCGILIDSPTVSELAEKLCILIGDKDLRTRMGRNGRKKAARSFDIKSKVAELERFFDSVLTYKSTNSCCRYDDRSLAKLV